MTVVVPLWLHFLSEFSSQFFFTGFGLAVGQTRGYEEQAASPHIFLPRSIRKYLRNKSFETVEYRTHTHAHIYIHSHTPHSVSGLLFTHPIPRSSSRSNTAAPPLLQAVAYSQHGMVHRVRGVPTHGAESTTQTIAQLEGWESRSGSY